MNARVCLRYISKGNSYHKQELSQIRPIISMIHQIDLPLQSAPSLFKEYPVIQLQARDPLEFVQVWLQPPLLI